MQRRQLTALTLAAATLAAAGCGGSSSKSLTRSQLIAKADSICHRVNAKLTSANGQINSQQDIARLAPQLAAYEQEAVVQLSKLTAPATIASDWKTIVTAAGTLAQNTAKLGEYAKANNLTAARALVSTSKKVQQQMLAVAKRDGFKDCSRET
jgi:hypothetical protein